MISTESGYEDWLEQEELHLKPKKTYTKEPTESGAKNIVFFVAQRKTGNMFMKY